VGVYSEVRKCHGEGGEGAGEGPWSQTKELTTELGGKGWVDDVGPWEHFLGNKLERGRVCVAWWERLVWGGRGSRCAIEHRGGVSLRKSLIWG